MANLPKLLPVFLLGTLLIAGCDKADRPSAAATGDAVKTAAGNAGQSEPPRPVQYLQVGLSNVAKDAYLPGEVRPRFEQRYGFRIGGKIARRLVDVGQQVKEGQVLAVLDSQDVLPAISAQEAQLDLAQSDFTLQQSELRRLQVLRDKGFLSGAGLERQAAATEAARARLHAAQSQLASARNALDFQSLRADKAGAVIAVEAEAGSVVAAGQVVIRVAQLGEREIVVNVPERAVAQMRKATGFTVAVDAVPGKTFPARLRELSPAADPASRTYAARLSVTDVAGDLSIGMSATVRLAFGAGEALVVPNSALYTRDEVTRVWLIDNASTTVKPVAVKVGQSTAEGVTIVSGLNPGDLVVTAGANLLLPGQKVRLLGAPVSAAAAEARGVKR